ncbi:glycosyltransferase [Candidatus Pelagibacter sp.]|nr:glycosyltransferase [Candidatus Pelagibacter sp.]|tara:strand:+ start:775 stop:1953 length:1179 start_codon:yes stop_codon:yes gene_type:complete
MRILVVTSKHQPEYSGSGLRARKTYKRLNKNYQLNFDILTNSINYKGNKQYEFDGVEIKRISPPFSIPKTKSFWRYVLVLTGMLWEFFFSWKFVRKKLNHYDLLHTFGNTWTIGFLSWYFSKNNKPVIRELCTDIFNPLYPIQFQSLMKKIFKKENSLVIAISKRLEKVSKNFDIKNIWTRFNQVEENKFFYDYDNKNLLRKKISKFKDNDKVLNLTANYNDGKNQLFALNVLCYLPEDYKLLLAGPLKEEGTDYFKLLLKKIDDKNLSKRVDIQSGFVDNIDEYMKCSDVFLFPSKEEGLGTPVLESQACGVPVVSSFIKDVTNTMIENGVGGYCLELNESEWAKAIQKALDIPRNTLIENSKKIYEQSSSKVIDKMYYEKIKKLISNVSN